MDSILVEFQLEGDAYGSFTRNAYQGHKIQPELGLDSWQVEVALFNCVQLYRFKTQEEAKRVYGEITRQMNRED